MDKPAERLTREKQFQIRVPIGAFFYYYIVFCFISSILIYVYILTFLF